MDEGFGLFAKCVRLMCKAVVIDMLFMMMFTLNSSLVVRDVNPEENY